DPIIGTVTRPAAPSVPSPPSRRSSPRSGPGETGDSPPERPRARGQADLGELGGGLHRGPDQLAALRLSRRSRGGTCLRPRFRRSPGRGSGWLLGLAEPDVASIQPRAPAGLLRRGGGLR